MLVVQSSTHGTDHACLLDAIAQLGSGARGVGMVDAAVRATELRRLTQGGIRAARFLMTLGGVVGWDEVERLAAQVADAGWFVNLQIRGSMLLDKLDTIARLPGPVVIDHMGIFGPIEPSHPSVRALLHLLDSGDVWVKMSAPYAGGAMGRFPYHAAGPFAQAWVRHAPNRLIWGSDWPHTFLIQVHYQPSPDGADLFDLLLDWVEDPAVLHQILVDNPTQLMGATLS